MEDELVSHISRRSIDILKTNYRVSVVELVSPLFKFIIMSRKNDASNKNNLKCRMSYPWKSGS